MPGDSNSPLMKLDAAASYQMFTWLKEPYGEVAAASDFPSLSAFEQWERLLQYVNRIGYLPGKTNVASLDEVSNQSKSQLLQWLDEEYQRNQRALPQKAEPPRRLLHIKA